MIASIPNVLTVVRLFLAVPMWYFLSQQTVNGIIVGGVLFCVAAATDFVDGYISRRYQLNSSFGIILDPIADKVLILTALWFFQNISLLSWGVVALITFREVLVTILRFRALKKGRVLAPEKSGKLKTGVQIASIIALISANLAIVTKQDTPLLYATLTPALLLFFWSAYLAILSGYQFCLVYWDRAVDDTRKQSDT